MSLKEKSAQKNDQNLDIDESTGGSALSEDASSNTSSASAKGGIQLIVEREKSFEEEEEEATGKVESWGVYFPSPEKTLIGLFWDKEIANFFKDSIQGSPLLNNLKKIAEKE